MTSASYIAQRGALLAPCPTKQERKIAVPLWDPPSLLTNRTEVCAMFETPTRRRFFCGAATATLGLLMPRSGFGSPALSAALERTEEWKLIGDGIIGVIISIPRLRA